MNARGSYNPRTGRVEDLTITISTDAPGVAVSGGEADDLTGQTAHGTIIDHPHSHNSGNVLHTHAHTHSPGDTTHDRHHNIGNTYLSPRS